MLPPPPPLLAGGDHRPSPASPSSPEQPLLAAYLDLLHPDGRLLLAASHLSSPRLPLALAFSLLTSASGDFRRHLVALHAAGARGGYGAFASALLSLPFPRLLPLPRSRLLLAAAELARAAAPGAVPLLLSILRHVPFSGDPSLAAGLLDVLSAHYGWLVDEEPQLLASAVFAYLRLLADHRRLLFGVKNLDGDHLRLVGVKALEDFKQKAVPFCVSALRDHLKLCLQIGRDLVRLLQDLALIPEFQALWKDLLLEPHKFGVPDFGGVGDICRISTPSCYILVAISPEMEKQLRFLMSSVKWGGQKRYQVWFAKKHLAVPGGEEAVPDIIRYVCCAHHPSNEVMRSGVIARWAIIGWLLTSCRKNYVEANAKLALFYDWLFFDEKTDSIMNIEPAMLLMVNSIPQYVEITHRLLEFLFLLIDNYDVRRKEAIAQCVRNAFDALVKKGVVHSLEPLTSCEKLAPMLRQQLVAFLSGKNPGVAEVCRHPNGKPRGMEQ